MSNYFLAFSFSNGLSIFLGIAFGFSLMVMIMALVVSNKFKKLNKNENVREISRDAYEKYYHNKDKMKEKLTNSLFYIFKQNEIVASNNKNNPIYELSINEIIDGLKIISKRLEKIVYHPLFKEFKNIHITTILSLERISKPALKIYNHKITKVFIYIYKVLWFIINLINPVYYLKIILKKTIFKQGKDEIVIICFDYVGNIAYEIYQPKKIYKESEL